MRTLAKDSRPLLGMLGDSARLLAGDWPALVSIFLIGATLHAAFLWAAVAVSDFSPLAAMFILPLAPISTLLAMVLMLRRLATRLPGLLESAPEASRGERIRADLRIGAHVLIPFLAVYASQGMVKADLRAFTYEATVSEYFNEGFASDFSRVLFASDAQALIIVLVALVLRKVIAGFGLAAGRIGVAGFAGYLEALWLVVLASWFANSTERIREWILDRSLIVEIEEFIMGLLGALGPIGLAIQSAIDQASSLLSQAGSLVVVPVAWLAVGASVYGSSLPDPTPLPTSEEMTARIRQIPDPIRRVSAQVVEPIVTPVKKVVTAIGKVAVAGVIPMVLLCLLLYLASGTRQLVTLLIRGLVGAQPTTLWWSITPHVDLLAQGVYTLLAVVLIASAVNRIVLGGRGPAAESL